MLTTERLVHPGGYHTPWHSHHAGQLWRIAAGLLVIETPLGRSVVPAKHICWIRTVSSTLPFRKVRLKVALSILTLPIVKGFRKRPRFSSRTILPMHCFPV